MAGWKQRNKEAKMEMLVCFLALLLFVELCFMGYRIDKAFTKIHDNQIIHITLLTKITTMLDELNIEYKPKD